MDYDRYNRRIPAGRPAQGGGAAGGGGGQGDYYGRGRRGTTQGEQIAAVNPQYYMMPHQTPYLQYPTTAQQPITMMTAPTSTAAQQQKLLPFLRAGGGGHAPTPPYATTPLTFQTTPIATTTPPQYLRGRDDVAGVKPQHYGAAPPILLSSPLRPPPQPGAGAMGAEVSPLLAATTKHKAVKFNTVTVSPTKSTDAHNSNNKKKQKRNKISKEDLKRAMNIPISSTAQAAAAAVGKGNNNKKKTKEDRRVKKERRERENNHRERETTKKNAIEIKSKRGTRERSRRSKRKRNPEKRYNDYDEKRRINETDRDEYDSESDEDEGDDYEDEDEDEDEERESWHDSRSRSRRRYGHNLSDDSYIDRRRRDDSYRERNSRSSRSRRRNEQRYNDYEYDAVEVGIDDEPWYFQASDMIQDSCPALNCDGYAEPDSYVGDYHGYEHTTRPAGRQRFYETTRNKAKPNARRTDYCCGDEVVIPQWLLFAVGGMIGCCFIF